MSTAGIACSGPDSVEPDSAHPLTPGRVSAGQMGFGDGVGGVVDFHPVTPDSPQSEDHGDGPDQGLDSRNEHYARGQVKAAWLAAAGADSTRIAYACDLDAFFAWCDRRGTDVLTAGRVDLDNYRQHLARRGYKPATRHRKLAALSSYYRHGTFEFEHLVLTNPVSRVRRPRVTNESSTASLDLAETRRLLHVARAASPRASAVVHLLAYTGMRVSELCTAAAADLHTERGSRVLEVTRKGGRRQRLVIAAPAVVELDAYLDGRCTGPLVVGVRLGPISRHEVARSLAALLVGAGIDKRITPHSLRHTAATLALDAGVDIREVQRMLGHANIETTMRYDRSRARIDRSPAHALAAAIDAAS